MSQSFEDAFADWVFHQMDALYPGRFKREDFNIYAQHEPEPDLFDVLDAMELQMMGIKP